MAKTRGVAMNPVDHPHGVCTFYAVIGNEILTNHRVVTINILVRPLQSRDTLHKVKRLVSLLLGELVCCVVLKRSRTRGFDDRVSHCFGYAGLAFMYLSEGALRG